MPIRINSGKTGIALIGLGGLAAFGASQVGFAFDPHDEYERAIRFAEKKVVQQQRMRNSSAFTIAQPVIEQLFGRYYRVGDSWDVAAFHVDSQMNRMVSDPSKLQNSTITGGVFHYEVVEARTGRHPKVVLKVTQTSAFGLPVVDSQIQKLTLTMTPDMKQAEKAYTFAGSSQPTYVSPDGVRSTKTLLELFPLDSPDVATAESSRASQLPELPDAIRKVAEQAGFRPDLSKSTWFEQDDFFGRPVQVLWQHGDPWPAYYKTAGGIAVLIHGQG